MSGTRLPGYSGAIRCRDPGEQPPILRLSSMRDKLLLLAGLLPAGKPKNWLLSRFAGVAVHSSARIRPSLWLRVIEVDISRGTRTGIGCVFKDLRGLVLAEGAAIGQFVLVSASPDFARVLPDDGLAGRLLLDSGAAVTNRHQLDCSGGIRIGRMASLAGARSTVLTHQIDLQNNRQVRRAVTIGARCFIGSDCRFVAGACVADRSVVAMGSVVTGVLAQPGMLYGGVPARAIRPAENAGFVERTDPFTTVL